MPDDAEPGWVTRGKSIRQLIAEQQSFEDQDLPVLLSIDGGSSTYAISLVARQRGTCALISYGVAAT